jgi:NADH-quinone oxidoreductase subunit I
MKNALKEIVVGFNSLLTGMRITLGQFFKPTVTVRYPHETPPIPARFRGHIELVLDPQTGKPICYACKLCERACPSDCILVEGAKAEGAKKKSVTVYKLDFTKCSLCGSCVEACRDAAIRYSRDYNLAGLHKEEFIMDLFAKLEAEAQAAGAPPAAPAAAQPVKTEPPAPAPEPAPAAGQAQRELRPTWAAPMPAPPPAAAAPKSEPPKRELVKVDAP